MARTRASPAPSRDAWALSRRPHAAICAGVRGNESGDSQIGSGYEGLNRFLTTVGTSFNLVASVRGDYGTSRREEVGTLVSERSSVGAAV